MGKPESGQGYELFDPDVEYKNNKNSSKMVEIMGKIGIVAGLGGVYYMAKNLKNKPKDMKLSVYMIHTRLLAQGSVVGVLSLGMIYQMYTKLQHKYTVTEQPAVR